MKPIAKGNSIILWGTAAQDAQVRSFQTGKLKTTLSLRYHTEKDAEDKKVSSYINVETWGDLARYAACVERGDELLVCGEYRRDDYRSQKKGEDVFIIKAAMILVQPIADLPEDVEEAPLDEADDADAFAAAVEEAPGERPY